jgi:hypothetical protein
MFVDRQHYRFRIGGCNAGAFAPEFGALARTMTGCVT